MKLVSVHFQGHRFLRDVEIKFSQDEKKPLTVVRGEPQSGKTTLIKGMQWILWGREALPDGYRLHHLEEEGETLHDVNVRGRLTIDHDVTDANGDVETKRYIIDRRTKVTVKGIDNWTQHLDDLTFSETTKEGVKVLPNPQGQVNNIINSDVRKVSFMDGDEIREFISSLPGGTGKRESVRRAIREVLGLELYGRAMGRVSETAKQLKKPTAGMLSDTDYQHAYQELSKLTPRLDELKVQVNQIGDQWNSTKDKIEKLDKDITESIANGDPAQIQKDKEKEERSLSTFTKYYANLGLKQSQMYSDVDLSHILLAKPIKKASAKLDELKQRGKIPQTYTPWLIQVLDGGLCICGESLVKDDKHYQHIQSAIDNALDSSEADDRMTTLFVNAESIIREMYGKSDKWVTAFKDVYGQKKDVKDDIDMAEGTIKELDGKINEIADDKIKANRQMKRDYEENLSHLGVTWAQRDYEIKSTEKDIQIHQKTLDKITIEKQTNKLAMYKLVATQDLLNIFVEINSSLEQEEVEKASTALNEIFLRMIGSDPETALISKALITHNHEIQVKGPHGQDLSVEHSLNGASKRALTLSFMLSLWTISGIDVPTLIDTPFGMMGHFVKKNTMEALVTLPRQTVLFLTRAEIAGIEDEIDQYAGSICTIINTVDYPTFLVNKPESKEKEAIVCACNHTQYCEICEHHNDQNGVLSHRPV